MFDTLVNRLSELKDSHADKPAVVFRNDQITYAALFERIAAIGGALAERGVRRGDRVLFSATSRPEAVALYLGIQYCGAIAVSVDKSGTPDAILSIYEDVDGALLLTDRASVYEGRCRVISSDEIYSAKPNQPLAYVWPDGEDIAEMIFTTGTTGKSKGVMLSYRAVYNITLNNIAGVGIRETDRILVPLPLHHSLALREVRSGLYLGATVVLQNGFTFRKELENNIINNACTGMVSVPASMEMVRLQLEDSLSGLLGRLRYIEVGAGSLSVAQRMRFAEALPNTHIVNTWGSSETGGAIFLDVHEAVKDPEKAASIGKPLPNVEVRTLNPDGVPFTSDRENPGRMALRGGMNMSGYWHRDAETKDALRGEWLLTGDMVYADADGFVYMLGRSDDIINIGGEKVSPIEIENVACQQRNVFECACIGVDDPKGVLGQVPVLYVVPANSRYSEEKLSRFIATKINRTKMPQYYVVIDALPRNKMLKIDRRRLKELWARRESEAEINPVVQAILTRRSVRRFRERVINPALIDMLVKAGYHAPSGKNAQSWRFTVLEDERSIAGLKAAAATAARENRVLMHGFENPKAVILVSNDSKNPDGCQDASCAAENIMLAAQSYGIGSTWINVLMTLRDKEPVKSLLDGYGIPAGHTVWATIVLGYPVVEGGMSPRNQDVVRYIDR